MPGNHIAAPLASVIVPVYNGEQFLRRCLDSVLAQSMGDLELIVVNDGSTDDTRAILAEYEASDARVTVIDQANAGQGAARNRALGQARGEFVLFVDADDFIERVTLQVTTERAIEDHSDLVHFDWKLYTPGVGRPGDLHYYNADPFWHKRVLVGIECDELLRVQNFYSVTKLYRRSFLDQHEIRFEEGRIYEDNPFVLQAVNRAEKASLVHSPLYTIDPHPESSTRTNTDTDKHVRDHLYAVRRTFEFLDRRNPRASAYLAAYHVKKIGPYYERRIPKRFRRAYVREFVQILHDADVSIPEGTSTNAPTRLAVRLKMFERNRATLFEAMVASKNVIMPRYKRAKRWAKRIKHRSSKDSAWSAALERALAEPIMPGTITFLGLDFKYTGNSRYLFEELLEDPRFADFTIRFVTADERVPAPYRLDPASTETYTYLARTKLLLAESWIPPRVRKHRDSTWVQLWHGTPIKRMLFDSHEPRIISRRPGHKASKYEDILRWDFLLAESDLGIQRFETAFLVPQEKLVLAQYPRVARFSRRGSNDHVRSALVRHFDEELGTEDKLILYAPTWRDVNYAASQGEINRSHLLDAERLSESLGPGYSVIVHEHSYLPARVGAGATNYVDASSWEIQELLAATDLLVTDYSSLYFDAIALGKPVVLYTPDLEAFREQRGLYEPTWNALSLQWPIARDEDEVASATHRLLRMTRNADASGTPKAARSLFVDLLVKKIPMLGSVV